jgi:hypothetical protein
MQKILGKAGFFVILKVTGENTVEGFRSGAGSLIKFDGSTDPDPVRNS